MPCFPRKWFPSTTNWLRANYKLGEKTISITDVLQSDGTIKFDDTTSNFSKIIITGVGGGAEHPQWLLDYEKSVVGRVDWSKIYWKTSYWPMIGSKSYPMPYVTEIHNCDMAVYEGSFTAAGCPNLEVFTCKSFGQANTACQQFLVGGFTKLKTIEVGTINDTSYSLVIQSYALTNFQVGAIKRTHSWSISFGNLDRDNLVDIINKLPIITSAATLTLGTNYLGKLTEADKKIATDKGWALA